jgi:peptide-methionine (S)-S-oxide reductase
LRGKYRSAIYVPGATDRTAAEAVLAALQASFDAPLVTRVLDLVAFKPSDPRFQNYYANGPKRPFCVSYIEPKLQMLRVRYGAFVTSSASSQTASSMP